MEYSPFKKDRKNQNLGGKGTYFYTLEPFSMPLLTTNSADTKNVTYW